MRQNGVRRIYLGLPKSEPKFRKRFYPIFCNWILVFNLPEILNAKNQLPFTRKFQTEIWKAFYLNTLELKT